MREELGVDFCIVNGENIADGAGITPKLADKLLASGADVVTLGNHVWRREGIGAYLEKSERVIRPANLSRTAPGRGLVVKCPPEREPRRRQRLLDPTGLARLP